jgi:ABC-type lipoprotein export system ATPase subunit
MIKLTNINKYFNRHKANEVHVINNTTLELPSTGLVCLLGASGSGKTTLLNVIGGLDKASGEIIYDDIRIKKYNMAKVDKVRRKNMGYIFQNYYLFPDMTVYDNLKFALALSNIFDQEEIEKRIDYCLKAVNMINYKRRKASALSGGQQQRVAIARALVKKSRIIIADEPTGNLDSNNSVEVMNIIKKVSETCLVILVTHDQNLASFYADRIIELKDGKVISDYINTNNDVFAHKDNRIIYLRDLNKNEYNLDNINLDFYYEEPTQDKIEIKAVIKDGSLVIDVKSPYKVKYITSNSEVTLKDEHYKEIAKSDINNYHFDNSNFIEVKGKRKIGKKLFTDFKLACSKFFNVKLRYKFIYIGFFLVGILAAYTIAFFSDTKTYDEKQYIVQDHTMITLINDKQSEFNINELLARDEVKGIAYLESKWVNNINISVGNTYQTRFNSAYFDSYVTTFLPKKIVSNDEIIMGRLPTNTKEIAIDQWYCDNIIQQANSQVGEISCSSVIGKKLQLSTWEYQVDFKITGIISRDAYDLVITDQDYINYSLQFMPKDSTYNLHNLKTFSTNPYHNVVEGNLPLNPGEVVVHVDSPLNIGDHTYLNKDYVVVGKYTGNYMFGDYINFICEQDAIEFMNSFYKTAREFNIFTTNIESSTDYIKSLNFEVLNQNEQSKEEYLKQEAVTLTASITLITILTAAILVFIYFMMRSRIFHRIYDIGVYRALGASRLQVTNLFIMEILVLTTFTSVIGYLITSYLINYLNQITSYFGGLFFFPWYYMILGLITIYGLNLLFGLLPVITLLRKTPSTILTKYDI